MHDPADRDKGDGIQNPIKRLARALIEMIVSNGQNAGFLDQLY